jgi:tryptophan halogenase
MNTNKIKKVVIAGGGTAGWITATALAKKLGELLDITLVESNAIGTIGVGEATIPTSRTFHKLIGIDEQELMRATNATFKLGIQFENWGKLGDKYFHSFGATGQESWLAGFQHFWLRGKQDNLAGDFGEYCLEHQAAQAGKFSCLPGSDINYAYHLDALLYAKFLKKIAIDHGVKNIEGRISTATKNENTGFIESLTLETGEIIEGDLFIDCTGFDALLIEKTLQTGFEDWSHLLPCDAAVAVQTEQTSAVISPFTRSIALGEGWRWCIPLQNRMGNGYVYSRRHISDDEATATLLREVDGQPLNEPRVIKHRPGIRRKVWNKNCLAIGLSGGFLEPLESTGIHLFMMGVVRLIQLFPFNGINQSLEDQYNDLAVSELTSIRDFIILHYHATQRTDTQFWRDCKLREIPATLAHRIDLFNNNAQAYQGPNELFRVDSWVQVMLGQGITPKHYHDSVSMMSESNLQKFLSSIKMPINEKMASIPSHRDFINQYCKSE